MTTLSLILSVMAAWMPTVDGQRVEFGAQADIPYWLGISCPPPEIASIEIVWGESTLELDNITGTQWDLLYIDNYCPVEFFSEGLYQGQIVPEPASILTMLIGSLFLRKAKK